MLELVMWVLFGALAGWIASLVARADTEQNAGSNITVGLAGALVGGFLMRAFGGPGIIGVNMNSLLVAAVAAAFFLLVYNAFIKSTH